MGEAMGLVWRGAMVAGWIGLAQTGLAAGGDGMAIFGDTKYEKGFSHFDYANPEAPKGGEIVLGWRGGFDTLNPYSVKGIAPLYIGRLVFQELGGKSLDEPFSIYPTVAKSFEVADDKLSMTVKLRKEAEFSDGHPIRAEDVAFSFKTMMSDKAPPFYESYWGDIEEVEAKDKHTVVMKFAKVNTELPLIAAELPVLPKHVYGEGDFGKDFSGKAVGSGPYIVEDFERGKYVTYKRNPKFWGSDLGVFKGRYNFDKITIRYYEDDTARLEAFKKGSFDLYNVYSSKLWATGLKGKKFSKLGYIKKELWDHSNNAGGQGFLFNLRKDLFKDRRVRKAMALAFDFEWANKNLFHGQYERNTSFFENSELEATGKPSKAELEVLKPLKKHLPEEVFTKEMGYLGKGLDTRKRLRKAKKLLDEAGYKVKNGVAQGDAGKLEFDFLMKSKGFFRILEPYAQNLARLGIKIDLVKKESSVYVRRLDNRNFAMTTLSIGQSESPGNEQKDFWGSKAANRDYSRNYSGIKNKAIDKLIDKVIEADTREKQVLYVKCLDRVLYHHHIMVHNWHIGSHRVAYWDKIGVPEDKPPYYRVGQLLEFLWYDGAKAKRLAKARKAGKPL